MSAFKRCGWPLWLSIVLLIGLVALIVGLRMAVVAIERSVREWLGNEAQIAKIDVSWRAVVLRDVRIRAPSGWPTKDALTADTVTLQPRWTTLLSNQIEIIDIAVRGYTLSAWRPPSGGIKVLPSLQAHACEPSAPHDNQRRLTHIGKLTFTHGKVDFYDAQISQPLHHIALNGLTASIGPLKFPDLNTWTHVDIASDFGATGAGRLSVAGTLALGTLEADIDTTLTNVAIHHLAPYLQPNAKVAFKRGVIDLSLTSTVRSRQIAARGKLTLSRLELADNSLAALPRKAAIAARQDDNGRATFHFKLTGPLTKPTFTLQEGVSVRIAGGLANALGISIEGLAHSISGTIESIGNALAGMLSAK
jgi:hypothetical protein